MANGYILWRGLSAYNDDPIVVIATGCDSPSRNRKTGPMIQTYILRDGISPIRASRLGADDAVCGDCVRRHYLGGDCYVNIGHDPYQIYKAYQDGAYDEIELSRSIRQYRGRSIRLGAYGDPAVCPYSLWVHVTSKLMHTGYTSQWRTIAPYWSRLLMASCDGHADIVAAKLLGYRTYSTNSAYGVICPAQCKDNAKQCIECMLCNGTDNGVTSINCRAHGPWSKRRSNAQLVQIGV